VYYHSLKPTGGDWSFSPKGHHLISISVHLLALFVAQRRVLLIILVFIIGVIVLFLLLLMLLSKCALGYWAPKYHQLDHKRLLLLRYVMWCILSWLLRLWMNQGAS
jgi:hypothetical protein